MINVLISRLKIIKYPCIITFSKLWLYELLTVGSVYGVGTC